MDKLIEAVDIWNIGYKLNKELGRTRPSDDYLYSAYKEYLEKDTKESVQYFA